MLCPNCKEFEAQGSEVYDSRRISNGQMVKRRRICPSCQGLFTTLEITIYQGRVNKTNRQFMKRLANYFSESENIAKLG